MGWLSGYSYRKKVTISGSSGAGENYQVKLLIGSSSGGDFHLEGHCENFPNDIRFTDDDGTTLLDYWIEDSTQDPITVWVKVKDNLDNNVDIYVYYGNPSASSASDGNSVFLDFIDKEDASSFTCDSNHYATTYNDYLRIYSDAGSGERCYKDIDIPKPFVYEMVWYTHNTDITDQVGIIVSTDSGGGVSNRYFYTFQPRSPSQNKVQYYTGSFNDLYSSFSMGTTYRFKIIVDDNVDFYLYDVDGNQLASALNKPYAYGSPSGNAKTLWIGDATGGTDIKGDIRIKFAFFRKYASPEPSFGSVGSETSCFSCTDVVGLLDTSSRSGPLVGSCVDALGAISSSSLFMEATWLPGFTYRKRLVISGSNGAGTGYQIKLKIGSSSGGDFHLNGHCDDFPNDIRFTKDDGLTLLKYWIEDPDQDPVTVWVKIEDNLDENVDIYCYYGSSIADTLSNGEAVFDFFDDFDYGNISSYLVHNGTKDWAVGGIELPNGDIIAAWEYSPTGVECSNSNYILASRSTDGGKTWGSSYTLQDTPNRRDVEPQFLVLGNTVYFFYGIVDENDSNRAGAIYYKTSTDNGNTWSEAHLIESSSHLIATISNPIKLENGDYAGRIILPAQEWDGSQWHSYVYYSDDNCSSWNRSNVVQSDKNLCEPTVVELSDGSLYMLMRNSDSPGGEWQYESKSTDGGVTWSSATSSSIQSPRAQSKLLKLSNGHIILLWNNVSSSSNTPRVPLSVAVSTDDCNTWSDAVDIRSGSGQYSNMGLLLKSNGEIVALYTDEINFDIYAAIFTEEVFNEQFSDKWDTIGSPSISFENSVMSMTCDDEEYIKSKSFTISPPAILEVKSKDKDSGTENYPGTYGFGYYHGTTYDTNGVQRGVHTTEQYDLVVCDNSGRDYTTDGFPRNTNFATYKIVWTSSICHIYENGVQKDDGDVTTHIPTVSLPVVIGRTYYYNHPNAFDVDWVFVRKYADSEPSFSSAQAEEGPVFTCGDVLSNSSIFNSLLSIVSRSQDALELIDSDISLTILLLNAIDSIDVSDGCTLSLSFTSSCLDVLHAIDSTSYPLPNVVSCLDSLGTQDSISSFLSMLCQSKDNIGGADGETSQLSVERALLDILAFQDTSSYLAGIIASASDILNMQDLNSIRLTFSCSSIDIIKSVDSGGVNVTFHLDGNDILEGADFVSGNLQVLLDSLAVFESTDQSASSLLGFILRSASDVLDMYDLNTATLQISSSSIDIFRTEDNSSINITLHLNSADVFKNSDSAILSLQALLSALETLKVSDSDTASLFTEILASASDLLSTSDYNGVRLEFLNSSVDVIKSEDRATPSITLHLDSSDILHGLDSVTTKLEAILCAMSEFKNTDRSSTRRQIIHISPVKIFKAQQKILVFKAENI
ncbi:MAG: hypothetical protein FHOMOCKG_00065 [Methanophagales virus GBV302]|uniref:DUF2341 domain-containing protein n=1 Tax=Methanophagales virus GBV302 TaxID=2999281 RepID=A0A9E9A5V7_9CAUD|nr:MAG: hypothetical protein QIT37_gp065 [Methanophagales virus GBV302]WAE39593.1 MAG: hypothetical protein FHOMOCKG_00065 [Methanophagales virus GBV302]